jgi:glutamate 5-kinase
MSSPPAASSSSLTVPTRRLNRVVVKLGSAVLLDEQGRLAIDRVAGFVRQMATLHSQGHQVVLVSSGAVALGRTCLKLHRNGPLTDVEQRACAAIGQSQLMNLYRQLFEHYGLLVGQVLINPQDFSDRARFCNAQETLNALLALGQAVPILNENDTLSEPRPQVPGGHVETASFGDNDQLSALVAFMVDADGLVLLSNVDGLYTDNPFTNPLAQRLPYIDDLEATMAQVAVEGKSGVGRGGMAAKLRAIGTATRCGVPTMLVSGLRPDSILSAVLFSGATDTFPGTLIAPVQEEATTGLRRWIGVSSGYRGIVRINTGAEQALRTGGASLLAAGITEVLGQFDRHQVVSVQNDSGQEIARGVSAYASHEVARLAGRSSRAFAEVLGPTSQPLPDYVIHRDKMFVFT